MGFLGGTGFKSFVTGAAREYKALTGPKEMTEKEKMLLQTRLDVFKKRAEQLGEADDDMIAFGDTRELTYEGPGDLFYDYTRPEFLLPIGRGETPQAQSMGFRYYTAIDDARFEKFSGDKQNELISHAVNFGAAYTRLIRYNEDGTPKKVELIPVWENIISNLPEWLRNALYTNQAANSEGYGKDIIKKIPEKYLIKVAEAEQMVYGGVTDYGQLDTGPDVQKVGEQNIKQTEMKLNQDILAHHLYQYGFIEKGKEESVIKRHITKRQSFPGYFTANNLLSETYLTSEQHYSGQAFTKMPVVDYNTARAAHLKIIPISRKAAVENTLGLEPNEAFHRNNIDLYTSMFTEKGLVDNKHAPSGQFTVKGKISKKETIEDLEVDMSIHNERGVAWTQYKGVHKLLMLELSNPALAIGGKGYENIALGIDMIQNVPKAIENIRNRMVRDKENPKFGRFKKFFNRMLGKTDSLLGQPLSASEKKWLEDHGYEGNINNISSGGLSSAAELNILGDEDIRGKAGQNNLLLASIARQRALTLELTYLAAAVVQGEGGKAISDGDQKQFKLALSYGWWSTPEQRMEAANAIYESLALYGELALGYINANTAVEVYGVRAYEKIADQLDFRAQSGKALIEDIGEDPEFGQREEQDSTTGGAGILVPILGLINEEDTDSVGAKNLEVHRERIISMYKQTELTDEAIGGLLQLDPKIFEGIEIDKKEEEE